MGARRAAALAAALAFAGPPVRAAPPPGPVAGVPVPPAPPADPAAARAEARWAFEVAERYGTEPSLLLSLRAIGLDHVDSECAVAVSTRAARPVAEVLDLRRAGMSWEEVARAFGFGLLEAILPRPEGRTRSASPRRERSRP